MKKLSEVYKELGIDFAFPIIINNQYGYETYFEHENGYWRFREYDKDCNQVYHEDHKGVNHDNREEGL